MVDDLRPGRRTYFDQLDTENTDACSAFLRELNTTAGSDFKNIVKKHAGYIFDELNSRQQGEVI